MVPLVRQRTGGMNASTPQPLLDPVEHKGAENLAEVGIVHDLLVDEEALLGESFTVLLLKLGPGLGLDGI